MWFLGNGWSKLCTQVLKIRWHGCNRHILPYASIFICKIRIPTIFMRVPASSRHCSIKGCLDLIITRHQHKRQCSQAFCTATHIFLFRWKLLLLYKWFLSKRALHPAVPTIGYRKTEYFLVLRIQLLPSTWKMIQNLAKGRIRFHWSEDWSHNQAHKGPPFIRVGG